MNKSIAIVIHWFGPYSVDKACELDGNGLYLVFGRNIKGRAPNQSKLLYCGISENKKGIGQRIKEHINDQHNYCHANNQWWIGRQVYPDVNADTHSREFLEMAEWTMIYFSGTTSNIKKTKRPPKHNLYVINEWFMPNESASGISDRRLRNVNVMKSIMDVQCWSPTTRLIRESNLKVFAHQE
jgi:hypothetical protein